MGVSIIITEKPSVAQEYKTVLKVKQNGKTDGYIEGTSPILGDVCITWAVGHLIKISEPKKHNPDWEKWSKVNLPMIPQKFLYEPQASTKKQFNIVKSLYLRKDIDCLYYAGDSGREGIYIQALIRNQIFKTKPKFEEKVVWIDSYTEDSILKGIKYAKPYEHYQPMIDSGYMRAISDWLIGINFTEAFTLTSGGYGNTINVGRVMTPTLAMAVERQKEIDSFTKTYFYGIKADGFAVWKAVNGSRYYQSDRLYNETGFTKKQDAIRLLEELSESKMLTVENVKVQKKTEYAPYLFNLAELQAYCSKHHKITPAQTLSIAQSLYEKKLITYPRTDARFLSSAVAKELKAKGYNVPNRYIDDSKITDHYAIIPTFSGNANGLSGLELSIYNAILKRFNNTMLPPYIYDAIAVTYLHKNKERFFENFRIVRQYGYKNGKDNDDNASEEIKDKAIPNVNDVVRVESFNLNEMETKPPVAYTTGSLILAMEKAGKLIEDEELREQIKTCGIGTSATRASIIDKLCEKSFITIDSKTQKIAPTDLGKNTIAIVSRYDEALVSPVKTAEMENNLNAIVEEELSKAEYLKMVTSYVSELTKEVISDNKQKAIAPTATTPKNEQTENTGAHNCPCCNKELKHGRYGWYCECKFSFNAEICGKKMSEKDLIDLIEKGHTKTYKFKSKSGNLFPAKLVLNKKERKVEFQFANK